MVVYRLPETLQTLPTPSQPKVAFSGSLALDQEEKVLRRFVERKAFLLCFAIDNQNSFDTVQSKWCLEQLFA